MKMKTIVIILSTLMLASCYTQKKAEKQVVKAKVNYPALYAKYCAPPTEKVTIEKEYIKGKDSIIDNTVYINCDSVANSNKEKPKQEQTDTKKVPVNVPCSSRVDTFREVKEVKVIDNNALLVCTDALEKVTKENIILEQSNRRLANQSYFLWSWFALSILGIGFIVYTKLFKPF